MTKKETLKKLESILLSITLITGSSALLSSCGKNETLNNKKTYTVNNSIDKDEAKGYSYYLVVNDKNAIIYRTDSVFLTGHSNRILLYFNYKTITLTDYQELTSYSIEEVETIAKALVGDDGIISYYGFDEDYTLKKTR